MENDYRYIVATQCMTYNQSAYIEDTLRGFAMQKTHFPVVYIIVDDASDDGEQDVLKKWANRELQNDANTSSWKILPYGQLLVSPHRDNNQSVFVILLLKDNHYQSGKHQLKMEYISEWVDSSKYNALCEGDDYWIDNLKLQKQVDYLDKNPDVSLCHTAFSYYDQEEHRLYENKAIANRNIEIEKMNTDLVPFILMFNDYRIQTCSVLYKTSSYKLIENQEREIAKKFLMGDTQRWCLLNSTGRIRFMNDNTCVYRVIKGSASHQKNLLAGSKFYLSSCEMRVFISRLFNLDKSYQTYFKKKLLDALISHKMLDAHYRPTIDPGFTFLEKLKYRLYTSNLGRIIIKIKKILYDF